MLSKLQPLPLAESYQRWITAGCDRRLLAGPDGLNPYGASWLPRAAIALSSCSCSSPSQRSYLAAMQSLETVRSAADPQSAIRDSLDHTRDTIRECLQIDSEIDIAFTPSGTDVEMLTLALAAGDSSDDSREIVNIVVAPAEVGSGTLNAAAACHYDSQLPRGGDAVIGQAVNANLARRVTVETIDARTDHGQVLSPAEIDAEVMQVVLQAVARDAEVVLHVVPHTKTGIHAPTLDLVDNVARSMPDITIVVDAAQGRLHTSAYRDALDRGYLVAFTGSKFFGGMPFSGALLVPPQFRPAARRLSRLPAGYESYFSRSELPESWSGVRSQLDDWCNLGLVMRWSAAASEIKAYFGVDPSVHQQVADSFNTSIEHWFQASSMARALPAIESSEFSRSWASIESAPTIHSFEVCDGNGERLDLAALKQLHRFLNQADGSTSFHLGQPVQIGNDNAVLRVALGAPLMMDVGTDSRLGSDLPSRLRWLHDQLGRLHQRCCEFVELGQPLTA